MNQTIKKVLALLLITTLFFLSLLILPSERKEVIIQQEKLPVSSKIFVKNEWDALQSTLLGSPDMLTEKRCSFKKGKRVCKVVSLKQRNLSFYKKLKKEIDDVKKVFDLYGVKTYDIKPEYLTKEELFYRNDINREVNFLCARAPLQIVQSAVIELTPPKRTLLPMRFAVRNLLLSFLNSDQNILSFFMPEPSPLFSLTPLFLNSADIVMDGQNIYLGYSGKTLPPGVLWFKRLFQKHFDIYTLNIRNGKNLDEVLALPNAHSVVAVKNAFLSDLPPPLKEKRIYYLSAKKEIFSLNNLIVLSPKVAIVDQQNTKLMRILKKEGFEKIFPVSTLHLHQKGASLRCLYSPLKRSENISLTPKEITPPPPPGTSSEKQKASPKS